MDAAKLPLSPAREFWLSKAGPDGAELLKLMEKEAAQ